MEIIKDQVKKVISYSQGIDGPKVDELIDNWYQAKEKFIRHFGGIPIYEVGKVSFHLSADQKRSRVNDFVDRVVNTYGNDKLGNFINDNLDGFFDNQVIKDYDNIPRGMKLVKAFKFFEPHSKAMLERLQNEASRIIQEDKIEGILCFSVHPLDYLSSSENTYNWRSCHALDGEYRAGNLSYMCDQSTVVCYLKTETGDAKLEHFPPEVRWNSKKWRMLLHFSDDMDMIMASRQYPFSTVDGLDSILDALVELFPEFKNPYYYNGGGAVWETFTIEDIDLWYRYIKVFHKLVPMPEIVEDVRPVLHYNDLLYSHYHRPEYICSEVKMLAKNHDYLPHFTIGSNVKCLQCGKDNIMLSETMRCDACELEYGTEENDIFGVCDCCGARMMWDDAVWINDDYRICPHCAETQTYTCPRCGEIIFREDMKYHAGDDEYYCERCMDEMMEDDLDG